MVVMVAVVVVVMALHKVRRAAPPCVSYAMDPRDARILDSLGPSNSGVRFTAGRWPPAQRPGRCHERVLERILSPMHLSKPWTLSNVVPTCLAL